MNETYTTGKDQPGAKKDPGAKTDRTEKQRPVIIARGRKRIAEPFAAFKKILQVLIFVSFLISPAAALANVDPADPGTTDPGTTDPADPGTTDPGTTDPGTTDPGTTDPADPEPEPLPDRDGDGTPDAQDLYPDDPTNTPIVEEEPEPTPQDQLPMSQAQADQLLALIQPIQWVAVAFFVWTITKLVYQLLGGLFFGGL